MSIPAVAVGIEEGDGTNFILGAQSSTIHNITQHDQHQPCIEGVVDLELVSHLVTGVTNSEFVDLLQHDVQNPQHLEEKSEEDQHLLQNSNLPTSSDTAYLSLSADPFVHTLVEVHNHIEKEPGDVDGSGYSVQKSFVSRPRSDTEVAREAFLLSVPKADDDENNNNHTAVSLVMVRMCLRSQRPKEFQLWALSKLLLLPITKRQLIPDMSFTLYQQI